MSDTGAYGGPDLGIPGIDSVTELARSTTATTYRVRDTATGRPVIVKVLNAGGFNSPMADRFDREQRAVEGLHEPPQPGLGLRPRLHHRRPALRRQRGDRRRQHRPEASRRRRPCRAPTSSTSACAWPARSSRRTGPASSMATSGPRTSCSPSPASPCSPTSAWSPPPASPRSAPRTPKRLAHVAPEVLQGRGVSTSSDIYSLGSILFSLLAGTVGVRRPLRHVAHSGDQPHRLRRRCPTSASKGVPDPAADAVEKAMAKDPAQRPASARELGRLLQQAQVSLALPMTEMTVLSPARAAMAPTPGPAPVGAPPPGGPPPMSPVPTGPVQPFVPGAPMPPATTGARSSSKLPWVLGGTAVVLLLVVGLLVVLLGGGDDPPAPPDNNGGNGGGNGDEIELTTVEDETGVIQVDVPEDWEDVNGQPFAQRHPQRPGRHRPSPTSSAATTPPASTSPRSKPTIPTPTSTRPTSTTSRRCLDGAVDCRHGPRRDARPRPVTSPSGTTSTRAASKDSSTPTPNAARTTPTWWSSPRATATSASTVILILANDEEREARDEILDSFEVSF